MKLWDFWPFRRKNKSPKWTIRIAPEAQTRVEAAATWVVYGGVKALVRSGEYVELHPESQGKNSPFDEECFARDGMAEHWSVQDPELQAADEYLLLMVQLRDAGLIQEYVWRFLREQSWPEPPGLRIDDLEIWFQQKSIRHHKPKTLAFLIPGKG